MRFFFHFRSLFQQIDDHAVDIKPYAVEPLQPGMDEDDYPRQVSLPAPINHALLGCSRGGLAQDQIDTFGFSVLLSSIFCSCWFPSRAHLGCTVLVPENNRRSFFFHDDNCAKAFMAPHRLSFEQCVFRVFAAGGRKGGRG